MMKPDAQVIEALTSLEHNNDFKRVIDWIEQSRDEARDDLVAATDYQYMRRCQGSVRELNELLSVAGNARDTINRMR